MSKYTPRERRKLWLERKYLKERGLYYYQGEWYPSDDEDNGCPECGGEMSWCTSCKTWTSTCCYEWGDCYCC